MEEARVEIRNLRRDAADALKKEERDGERRDRRGASPARDAPEDDRPPHRRGRPPGGGEGTGGPRGLVARAPPRPTDRCAARGARATTDAEPGAMPDRPDPAAGDDPARCRPMSCRATSRSSWTATAAGPRQRDLPELDGHAAGVEAIRALLRHAVRRGVPVLTLYAFSRENWARSDEEVDRPVRSPRGGHPRARPRNSQAQGVRVRLLGRLDELPDATRALDRRGARRDRRRRAAAPQHRVQLRRPDRDRRRRPPARRERHPRRRDRRGRRSAARCTPPACPTPIS